MSRLASAAASAFALANCYLLFLTGPLASPRHDLIFHLPGSASALFRPVLLDLLALWLVLTGLLWLGQRRPALETPLWAALLFALPAAIIGTIAAFTGTPAPSWLPWTAKLLGIAGVVGVLVRPRASRVLFARCRPLLVTVLGFLAVAGLVLLGQLLWFGWQARELNPPFVARDGAAASRRPGAPHVLWIILDELAFDQLYGRRPAGLQLPNFDRLASTATVFTHTVPAGEYTRVALPSLLTGLAVNAATPDAAGARLALHLRGGTHWQPLQPGNTVFGDAAGMGLSTGVTGWYEPYCRLFPRVLDQCFWTYSDEIPGGMSTHWTLLQNAIAPLRSVVSGLLRPVGRTEDTADSGTLDVRRHRSDYQTLVAEADKMLQNQPNLLLLHMPVPHPWGFYDRANGTFPDHRTSYLDNLALADLYLGHIRAGMEARGAWDNTDVVIMGDHSWRTSFVWKHSGFWTAEEQSASHGDSFDDRPAVIVKLHGQTGPARLDATFAAVRTRTLLDALLGGRLRSSDDLTHWVEHWVE